MSYLRRLDSCTGSCRAKYWHTAASIDHRQPVPGIVADGTGGTPVAGLDVAG